MRRLGYAVLTIIMLGGGVATAQEPPPTPPTSVPPTEQGAQVPKAGRYVFYPAQAQGGLEYLLDSETGDLWVISRDPDTKYVYLGFIPKGPTFTFQDILRQKQLRRVPAEP
ncbi:MAG: hypothetical protein ACE5IQ_05675 [Candidatus Methylomirabilales bacterium]